MHVQMADNKVNTDAKGSQITMQTKAHEALLDTIDKLRSQGISRFIDLPQLIVCGDQSSGKSSVLEAVSGRKFPTKDGLCTRFATEVILRRSPQTSTSVSIVPDANRPDSEKAELLKFHPNATLDESFGDIIEQAGDAMGIDDTTRKFSADVLRIEISGPTQPHLTLVDLPGLFHASSKAQSLTDAAAVKDLVTGYMQKPRSIILAIISAKNDLANQIVTTYANEYDKGGSRTLGIITKPDTLDAGSDSEKKFFELAENKDIHFRLGWHVLKNRDYKQRDSSTLERDADEESFFSSGIWSSLGSRNLGVTSLRLRLSEVLKNQILKEMPGLLADVDRGLKDCEAQLDRLGQSRGTIREQRAHLHAVSEAFTTIIKDAVHGRYSSDYFGDAGTDEGYFKRIRAVTNNLLEAFAKDMRCKGHKFHIRDGAESQPQPPTELPENEDEVSESGSSGCPPSPPYAIDRETRVEQIRELIHRNRGTELPGFFKEDTITALFRDQSSPWVELTELAAEQIFEITKTAVLMALETVCDQATREGVLIHIVNPALDEVKTGFDIAVTRTLKQHVQGHPITFNHYFTDNIQNLRNDHYADHIAKILTDYFGVDPRTQVCITKVDRVNTKTLLNALAVPKEADMTRFACSEALHFMEAYYKVALKYFTDDFAIAAVEQTLIAKLETIFHPTKVFGLDDEIIEDIAGETEAAKDERAECMKKIKGLKDAQRELKKVDRSSTAGVTKP